MYHILTPCLTVPVEFKNSIGVYPGKQNFHRDSPLSAGKGNFHWGAPWTTGIRNCYWCANMSIQISLGFTPVGHWSSTLAPQWHPGQPLGWQGRFRISLGWRWLLKFLLGCIPVHPGTPQLTPVTRFTRCPGWGRDTGFKIEKRTFLKTKSEKRPFIKAKSEATNSSKGQIL